MIHLVSNEKAAEVSDPITHNSGQVTTLLTLENYAVLLVKKKVEVVFTALNLAIYVIQLRVLLIRKGTDLFTEKPIDLTVLLQVLEIIVPITNGKERVINLLPN